MTAFHIALIKAAHSSNCPIAPAM